LGSQNLKVGHVTQATLPCGLILYFWISTSWCPVELQISTWLDLLFWRYCHCYIAAFWLENAYSGLFLVVLGILTPWNCDIVALTPKGMQYFQRHSLWDITRQNRSSGLTPSCANVQTKKAQTIDISPFRGGHVPEPIDMPFGVLNGLPDVITHAKFCVDQLRGFSAAAPRKVPFPILFSTTLTTVLHYRADCDIVVPSW